MKEKICIDLCSGLGGFSQAFKEAGWKVITIDINPKFNPTIVADITKIDWEKFKQEYLNGESPDVILASPPCERFSIACTQFPKKGIMKALEIVGACLEAIAILKPKRWLLENPRGRLRWIIGIPPKTICYGDYDFEYKAQKITDLWGNIPLPMIKGERRNIKIYKDGKMVKNKRIFAYNVSRNPSKRAEIPRGVSQAVLDGYLEWEKSQKQ